MIKKFENGIGIFILILRDIIRIECKLFRVLNFVNDIYIEEFKMRDVRNRFEHNHFKYVSILK